MRPLVGLGLLGRPRLLACLVACELLVVLPIEATARLLLGRAADLQPATRLLVELDAQRWAELLFVEQRSLGVLLAPLLVAVAVWILLGAALPATFLSALERGERRLAVAEATLRHAPRLWRLALEGLVVRALLLVPAALVAWALMSHARIEPSFRGYVAATAGTLGLALPAWALGSVLVDAARVAALDGERRPFAVAGQALRRRVLPFVGVAFGYGLAWLGLVAGYLGGAKWVVGGAAATLFWRALFVSARLVVASGRLLAVAQAMRTDSK